MTKSNSNAALQLYPHSICAGTSKPHRKWYLLTLFLSLLGFGGTTLSVMSLYQPQCNTLVTALIAVLSFLSAAVVHRSKRISNGISAIFVLLTLGVLLLAGSRTVVGIQYLVNQYYRIAHHTDIAYFEVASEADPMFCVTLVVCCVTVLLAFFFVHFTVKRPLFWLPAAVIFALIEPGLYMGIALSPLAAAPLLAYCCGMLAVRLTLRQSGAKASRNTAAVCGSCTALLVLIVYGITAILGICSGYTRSEGDRIRRRNFSHALNSIDLQDPGSLRSFGALFGTQKGTEQSALGTKSQLSLENDPELTLTFDQLPESALYLKGFTGCTYTDNRWLSAVDDAVSADTQQITDIIATFQCAPQNFPFLFQRSISPDASLITCTVTPEKRMLRNYQPYIAFSEDAVYQSDTAWTTENASSYSWTISDAFYQTLATLDAAPLSENLYTLPDGNDAVVQKFLRALNMDNTDIVLRSRFPMYQAADEPMEIRGKVIPAVLLESSLYQDYVKEAYTILPEEDVLDAVYEILPDTLRRNASPQTPEEQYQLLYDLRTWISERTEYSTAPGKTPGTRDFISFFLLENQKGYCMHYATAGTVLARYLGIPARYCEGYIVGADILDTAELTEDGYQIVLTDEQSHAWCEFYIDGYGWVPFEMTPGYYRENSTSAQHAQTESRTTTASTSTRPISSSEQIQTETHTAQSGTTSITLATAPRDSHSETTQNFTLPGWGKAICIVCVLCILAILFTVLCHFFRIRHIRYRQRILQDTANPRRAVLTAYRYVLQLLQFCGIPYHGQFLLDYCDTVRLQLKKQNLPTDAAIQVITLALAADMGNQLPTPEKQREVMKALLQFADVVYAAQSPLKRLRMRLMHLN